MRPHPDSSGFCLAVGQEVNDLVALHVHQDAAELQMEDKVHRLGETYVPI